MAPKGAEISGELFWLGDAQFAKIEPLLPTKTRGVKRVDDRPWLVHGGRTHRQAPQDIFDIQSADVCTGLGLGDSGNLVYHQPAAACRPLRSFGSTGKWNTGALVSSVAKAQIVFESVASKLAS